MAYQFNWATGEFDEISVTNGVAAPLYTLDGEIELPLINNSYSRLPGVIYFATGAAVVAGGPPPIGQPIPIGMGLTITYSQGASKPPISIKRGQPIPTGMGLTITYANDVT